MVKCPKCDHGWVEYEEDGRRVRDACYHCGNSGFISDEQEIWNRVNCVAEILAHQAVCRLKAFRNSDPEGEGWAFCAAENMMSEHDYTMVNVMDYTDRMMEIFRKMYDKENLLLDVLLDVLFDIVDPPKAKSTPLPPTPPKPVPAILPQPKPMNVADDDDLPF